jgi:uncharacterized protein YcgI (DUF1989 family)
MTKWSHPMPPFPREFYEELRRAKPKFRKLEEFVIPLEERGKAFILQPGQSARIVCVEGPQIADVCIWNANDYKERFWNDYTLCREGFFLSTYSRLWSNLPMFRPLMTIIDDTVETKPTFPGAKHHYCFGSHCNPHFWYWSLGDPDHPYVTKYNCWCNLTRAIEPFGLGPENLHDNINLFQKTHFELDTGLHPVEPSDAKKGDYVEFYAEMDVLMAISICPSGSGTSHWSNAEEDTVLPLGIEIWDTGVEPLEFENVFGPDGCKGDLISTSKNRG